MNFDEFDKNREGYSERFKYLLLDLIKEIGEPELIILMMADVTLACLEMLVKLTNLEHVAVLLNIWLKEREQ